MENLFYSLTALLSLSLCPTHILSCPHEKQLINLVISSVVETFFQFSIMFAKAYQSTLT